MEELLKFGVSSEENITVFDVVQWKEGWEISLTLLSYLTQEGK